MGKYTRLGSDALDERIDNDLARITDRVRPYSFAGILLGGYGRGEGTPFINADGTQSPFNDYDLVIIVDTVNLAVRLQFQDMEKQLTKEIGLPVDLCPYARTELVSREFSLLNYEMKYGHMVLWGEDTVLDAMPDYPHDGIPLSEGSRLLLNRGKLLLDIKQRLGNPDPLTAEEYIRFTKFILKTWLALGDCALLSTGQYDLSYSVKKTRIKSIGDINSRDAVIDGYLKAVERKEWGDYLEMEGFNIAAEFSRARDVFLEFLPWYRSQYSANECSLLKAAALNLRWNGRPLFRHPRLYLYDALAELLKDKPNDSRVTQMLFSNDNHIERFYMLQRRFS